ncbi:unnamed protein product [Brugia timori]|uniref:Tyrosine-protein phosphatase domain-containing protein n=1 Tax=Brugia timori TaxID=42155 RepID=A0A0R3R6V8_9BILA|nr:unnamed protein product [Brugia timori]
MPKNRREQEADKIDRVRYVVACIIQRIPRNSWAIPEYDYNCQHLDKIVHLDENDIIIGIVCRSRDHFIRFDWPRNVFRVFDDATDSLFISIYSTQVDNIFRCLCSVIFREALIIFIDIS